MLRLNGQDQNFEAEFTALLGAKREADLDVSAVVTEILSTVRRDGDSALLDYTRRFDRVTITDAGGLRLDAADVDAAVAQVSPERMQALEVAAARIYTFHEKQLPQSYHYTDALGVRLGCRWNAVQAAGLYVPGGTASYPSSVLMNAIPAKVAGVKRLVMVVPTPDGTLNPLVLAAARLVGVDEIYRIGGAQAVAALAYGTKTIAPVDKIVGPGNAYVAEAKRQVFGTVGIDMIAGPSEILVVADGKNNPQWIAADLLSQAEHDTAAQSILITDDVAFADAVTEAVEGHLQTLPRQAIARQSWDQHGAVIVVELLERDAPPLVDRVAPEHLELAVDDPEALAAKINNAGAMFLGRYTPEAIGDYVGGPNHVLPTARSARFSSGLGVLDFMKRTTMLGCDADSLRTLAEASTTLAAAEGLDAHGLSVSIRLNL